MHRIFLLVIAGAVMASAQRPAVLLWAQVAVTPPGSNPTTTTDVVPETPQGQVPNGAPGTPATGGLSGVITGGVAVPGAVQQGGSTATGSRIGTPSGGTSSVTGAGVGGAPVGPPVPGGAPAGPLGPGGTGALGSGGGSSSGGSGHALPKTVPARPECHPILTSSRATLGAEGGVVQVRMNPLPADCVPDISASADWLQLNPAATRANEFTFLVAANPGGQPRSATVQIDQTAFAVEQRGRIRTRMAASPARVLVGVSPKRTQERRELAVWADDSAAVMAVSSTAKWLQVQSKKTRKNGSRMFDLVVDSASVTDGIRHEGQVVISTEGAPPLTIPVIVEGIDNR